MTNQQHIETAEQLMREIAPVDLAGGFAVVPGRHACDRVFGWSIGNGHTLAAAAGLPAGTIAVGIDVEKIRRLVEETTDDFVERLIGGMVARTTAHELAHALCQDGSYRLTGEQLAKQLDDPAPPARPDDLRTSHHARWAAAYGLLLNRACRLWHDLAIIARPADTKHHDVGVLLAALGPVPLDVSIRDLLAAGSPASLRVEKAPYPVCSPAA